MARFDLLENLNALRCVCPTDGVYLDLEREVLSPGGGGSPMAKYLAHRLAEGFPPQDALLFWRSGVPSEVARALVNSRPN